METFEADSLDEDSEENSDFDRTNSQNSLSPDILNNTQLNQNNDDVDIDTSQIIRSNNEISSSSEENSSNARYVVDGNVNMNRTRSGRNVRPRNILDL